MYVHTYLLNKTDFVFSVCTFFTSIWGYAGYFFSSNFGHDPSSVDEVTTEVAESFLLAWLIMAELDVEILACWATSRLLAMACVEEDVMESSRLDDISLVMAVSDMEDSFPFRSIISWW